LTLKAEDIILKPFQSIEDDKKEKIPFGVSEEDTE